MKEFYTRKKANAGKKMNLVHPDGSPTDHWVRVLGVDSDVFRSAQSDHHRLTMEISERKESGEISSDEAEAEYNESWVGLLASAIVEWSFDGECDTDTKVEFLREAPQIATAVNIFIGNRKSFFGIGSKDSTNSPSSKEISTKSSKDPKPQKEAISNP